MAKQKETIGSIVAIKVLDKYYYAQILEFGYAFFDINSTIKNIDLTLINSASILFIVSVFPDFVRTGRWEKTGKLPVREDLKILPLKFIQDPIKPTSFSLYDPNTGIITESTKDQCRGLERCAVWEGEHIEQRLMDHHSGKVNIYVQKDIDAVST